MLIARVVHVSVGVVLTLHARLHARLLTLLMHARLLTLLTHCILAVVVELRPVHLTVHLSTMPLLPYMLMRTLLMLIIPMETLTLLMLIICMER